MSLRSIGNQLLLTAPSRLLAGASTASLSLWIRVNPGHNVADADGVEIFGDTAGKLSATLSGTGNLRLRWSSIAGNTSGGSSCSLDLAPGTSYHLAAVWRDGAQRYYLNGVQVKADTQSGAIGVLGDAAAHPFRLGSDSAGTDASLGDPTLWVGHALSDQDVVRLRDRAVSPSSIAPSSIALRWSLSGPEGVAAQAGDPGLADASPSGLGLSTVVGSAPRYQADLTYIPPLRAMVAPSGESFVVRPMDGSGNRREILSIQSGNDEQTFGPTLSVVGGSFAVTLDGDTSAPIAYEAVAPARFALWHDIPVVPGAPYRISIATSAGEFLRNNTLVEIIESGRVRVRYTLDQHQSLPGDFLVPNGGLNGGTNDISFRPIDPYLSTAATISVRMSAPANADTRNQNIWVASAIHLQKLTTGLDPDGPAVVHGSGDPAYFSYTKLPEDSYFDGGWSTFHNGSWLRFLYGSGAGSTYTYPAGAAGIRGILEALPSIGAGNVAVGLRGSLIHAEFVGGLGATAMPDLASDSPAVTFDHIEGGFVPSIEIRPQGGVFGAPVRLRGVWIPTIGKVGWAILPFDGLLEGFVLSPTDEVRVTIPAGWMTLVGIDDVQTITFANSPTGGTFKLVGTNPVSGAGFTTGNIAYSTDPRTLDANIAAGLGALLGNLIKVKDRAVTWSNNARSRPAALMTTSDVALAGSGATPTVAVVHTTTGVVGSTLAPGVYPAENLVGGTMLPEFQEVPKTMGIGQNYQPDAYYSEGPTFRNWACRSGNSRVGPLSNGDYAEWDANGDPTKMRDQYVSSVIVGDGFTLPHRRDGVNFSGNQLAPFGKWTFYWGGPFDKMSFAGTDTSFTEDMGLRIQDPGDVRHRRVFDCQPTGTLSSPQIRYTIEADGPADSGGKFPASVKRPEVYSPDPADPTGQTAWLDPAPTDGTSGRFHPTFLEKIKSAHSLRPMQALTAFYNPYADFDQIRQDNWTDRSGSVTIPRIQVESIRQYTGPALDQPHVILLEVRTVQPHGFFNGMPVSLEGCGIATLSDSRFPQFGGVPGQLTLQENSGEFGLGTVDVIDDHTFAFHGYTCKIGNDFIDGVTMTNVTTGGAVRGDKFGTPFSVADCVAMINDCDILWPGVPRRLWFTLAVTATDACIAAIADYCAANLRPGVKFCMEFGNECWNFVYATYGWLCVRSFQQFGLSNYFAAYAVGQGRANNITQARFDAAGRGDDFVHLFATFSAGAEPTDFILGFAANPPNGDDPYRVDEVAIAPYTSNYNPGGFDNARSAAWSVGQHLDLMELTTEDHGYSYTADKREVIDRYYPDAAISTYEGGWEGMIAGSDPDRYVDFDPGPPSAPLQVLYPLVRAIHRHPRMYGITRWQWQVFQDDGIVLHTNFYVQGGGSWQAWSTYESWDMGDGTGDPAENPDYRNTSNFTTGGQVPVVSQVGGSIHDWNALVGAALGTLSAGMVAAGKPTGKTAIASASAVEATGGTAPYAHQWYRSSVKGQAGSPVPGQTTLTLSDAGLAHGTNYYYQLKYTDKNGIGSSVFSEQIAITTPCHTGLTTVGSGASGN